MAVAGKKKKIFDNRYEILSILGRGARSVVYHARYVDGDHEEVALKVLLDKREGISPSDLLRKEALAMVSSRHKYVIRLDDFHSLGDLCYLTMELAKLGDLRQYKEKKGGKLSATQTELFLLQAAEAVDFIHKAGILHRDLKPENILVIDDQNIRIGDFGVAILPGEKSSLEELRSGVGTLDYLSPEVLQGANYDKRSDLYAVGVTFYELLSGVHPFANVPLAEQIEARRNGNFIPIRERTPDAPAHLLSAITKLLRFDPNDRFQNSRELIQALVSFDVSALGGESTAAPQRTESEPDDVSSEMRAAMEVPTAREETPPEQETPSAYEEDLIEEYSPTPVETQSEPEKAFTEVPLEEQRAEPSSSETSAAEDAWSPSSELTPQAAEPEESGSLSIKEEEEEPPYDFLQDFASEEPKEEDLQPIPAQYGATSSLASKAYGGEVSPTPMPLEDSPEESLKRERKAEKKGKKEAKEGKKERVPSGALFAQKKTKPSLLSNPRIRLIIGAVAAIGLLYLTSSFFIGSIGDEGQQAVDQSVASSDSLSTSQGSVDSSDTLFGKVQSPPEDFPFIPPGVYSGQITSVETEKSVPFSLIALQSSNQIIMAIGIHGFEPVVIDLSQNAPVDGTIRIASHGMILSLSGKAENGSLSGELKNEVTGETSTWRVAP